MTKFRGGVGRIHIDFWDKFEFVGNSYDDRVIWAVGQSKADSMGSIPVMRQVHLYDVMILILSQNTGVIYS
jgi:hypothetical protein